MNLLYCLDENYNEQAYISILSLIKNSPGLNFYIIHQDPDSFEKYHETLSELKILKFIYIVLKTKMTCYCQLVFLIIFLKQPTIDYS